MDFKKNTHTHTHLYTLLTFPFKASCANQQETWNTSIPRGKVYPPPHSGPCSISFISSATEPAGFSTDDKASAAHIVVEPRHSSLSLTVNPCPTKWKKCALAYTGANTLHSCKQVHRQLLLCLCVLSYSDEHHALHMGFIMRIHCLLWYQLTCQRLWRLIGLRYSLIAFFGDSPLVIASAQNHSWTGTDFEMPWHSSSWSFL